MPRGVVIWVDPGLKTGIAVWHPFFPLRLEVNEYGFRGAGQYLSGWGNLRGRDVSIGWERFIITPTTHKLTQAPWSLEVIGMCRWIASCNGWEILEPNQHDPAKYGANPGDRDLGKPEWVDKLGWCPKGMRDDGMSACQHMLAWMLRSGNLPSEVKKILFPGTADG